MIGGASSPAASPSPSPRASPAATSNPGTSGGVRVLARGRLFESAGREVSAPPSCRGRGLVRLADGSGWAIVPSDGDLRDQFALVYGDGSLDGDDVAAYEEIGSAFVSPPNTAGESAPNRHPQQQNASFAAKEKEVVWLRIVAPPDGIRVLLPPPRDEEQCDAKEENPESPPAVASQAASCSGDDSSEVASSFAGSFFDSVLGLGFRGRGQRQQQQQGTPTASKELSLRRRREDRHCPPPVVACGMVVPVDPPSSPPSGGPDFSGEGSDKCFARLAGGQGWIPRRLGGVPYAAETGPPEIRTGSFWFRVRSPSGVDARRGPSPLSPAISSGDGENGGPTTPLRFECGEYLRASEVLTVRRPGDTASPGAGRGGRDQRPSDESYVRLYRRRNAAPTAASATDPALIDCPLSRYASLRSYASPAEWVPVREGGNGGELLLDECDVPPRVERNRSGWTYEASRALPVRVGPSELASATGGHVGGDGRTFAVTERVEADGVVWLRARDGGGWVGQDANVGEVRGGEDGPECGARHSQRMVRQILEKKHEYYV